MRKAITLSVILLLTSAKLLPAHAQLQELEQLILDIKKLSQFKSILSDMYKGYEILTNGYNAIRDISQGNFNLHKVFLDGLLTVSPQVKKYERIAEIISGEHTLISQYQASLGQFKNMNIFSSTEISYIESVYTNLVDRSLKNLDELLMVITDSQVRMNDAERINAIDHINADMQDKIEFLRNFNDKTGLMAAQRQKDLQEISTLKSLYGLPN